MKQYLDNFNNCLQHEPSFCSAACPFGLDVPTFIARLQEGRFDAAYKAYRDSVGFPFIAAEICHEPCKEVCLKNAVADGDPIELKQLEKACLSYTKSRADKLQPAGQKRALLSSVRASAEWPVLSEWQRKNMK